MLNVENRTPYPGKEGRVRIRMDDGQTIEGVLEMADDATAPGSPWNRQSGRLIQADIRTYPVAEGQTVTVGDIVDVVDEHVGYHKKQLSQFSVGDIVKLKENGILTDYIVVNQGKPSVLYDSSCNGTWLLRKDVYSEDKWDNDNSNVLPGADIFTTMENMLKLYDEDVQGAIKTVKIPYCVGGNSSTIKSGSNGLSCKLFPLAAQEVGLSPASASVAVDGAKLQYFIEGSGMEANARRKAFMNNEATDWWLRSQKTDSGINVARVASAGGWSTQSANKVDGIRPALILPSTFYVMDVLPSTAIALESGTSNQEIEVIFSGTVYANWITKGKTIVSNRVSGIGILDGVLQVFSSYGRGNCIYGEYVGTGKYGEDYPNSITADAPIRSITIYATESTQYGNYEPIASTYGDSYKIYPTLYAEILDHNFVRPVGFSKNGSSSSLSLAKISEDRKTVTWYNNTDADSQWNNAYYKYFYIIEL